MTLNCPGEDTEELRAVRAKLERFGTPTPSRSAAGAGTPAKGLSLPSGAALVVTAGVGLVCLAVLLIVQL